ncbi:MAG: RHS repeat-associated core domain-containing protein [Ruminococcaceae bacterium]|nr:RHS repeat-associated core domain-containing protein [Oscillospiraceae bacterium]
MNFVYDTLNRIGFTTLKPDAGINNSLNAQATFVGDGNRTTTLVDTYSNYRSIGDQVTKLSSYKYTYDDNGNIHTVKDADENVTTYTYDQMNQLTAVEDQKANIATWYTYDAGGNLINRRASIGVYGAVGKEIENVNYSYGNANWKDLLTSYNGQSITYDQIGNPLTYRDGMSFTWEGRQLKTAAVNGKETSYAYNSDGIRTSKTVNGITTDYFVDGNTILAQNTGYDTMWFMYDSDGTRVGFTYKDAAYYYTKNAQGDVTGIVDSDLNTVVEYSYDAWGKLLITTGSKADTIGKLNPFLYRGYYFDAETGLYYLNSRYYDVQTGRFLNVDDTDILLEDQDNLAEHNLFAYCLNNPVNMADDDGGIAWWIAAAVGGAAFDTAAYIIGAAVSGQKVTWAGVGKAALAGAISGVAFGAVGKIAAKSVKSVVTASKMTKTGVKIAKAVPKISHQAIEFAVSSTKRLQHAFKHASSFGFGNWNGTVAKQWACFVKGNLTFYTKTFSNTLGNDAVTGYYRYFNGQHVATYIYNSGPNKGLVASVVELSANQMTKFGLW